MREVDTGRSAERDAPAKLNLGLRVLGRRADGYHEIESLFVPLDLRDRVRVELLDPGEAADGSVELALNATASDRVPGDASNLAVRAATAFFEAAAVSRPLRIELWKRVPAGAGLGGGSSDAAAVLRALSELLPDRVAPERIASLALALGADVPFFLDPAPAVVTGIGERIDPVDVWPEIDFLLLKPAVSLETAAVYAGYDELGAEPSRPVAAGALAELAAFGVGERADTSWLKQLARIGLLENDLEPAARALCPAVASLRRRLQDLGAAATGMSGSGPTVFGMFRGRGAARAAQGAIDSTIWSRVATSRGAE